MPEQRKKTHLSLIEGNRKKKRDDGKAAHKNNVLYDGMQQGIEPRRTQQAKYIIKDAGKDSRKDCKQKYLGLAKLG